MIREHCKEKTKRDATETCTTFYLVFSRGLPRSPRKSFPFERIRRNRRFCSWKRRTRVTRQSSSFCAAREEAYASLQNKEIVFVISNAI